MFFIDVFCVFLGGVLVIVSRYWMVCWWFLDCFRCFGWFLVFCFADLALVLGAFKA